VRHEGKRLTWDEVEREFYLLEASAGALARAFASLARALRRERERASVDDDEGHERDEKSVKTKSDGGQSPLPFQGDST